MKCDVIDCDNSAVMRGVCHQHNRRLIEGRVRVNDDGELIDYCQHDHALVGSNVRWESSGKGRKRRRCRACLAIKAKKRAAMEVEAPARAPEPYWPSGPSLSRAIEDFTEARKTVKPLCRDNPGPYMDWDDPPSKEEAQALCASCPLRPACRNLAIANHETHGVWGGEVIHEGEWIR